MAARRHNLTRRALLGAGVVLPAIAGSGYSRAAIRCSAWSYALRRFRRAEAELAGFRSTFERLPEQQRTFPACEVFEARFDTLETARLAALIRLLGTPAPTLRAMAVKLELSIDEAIWELTEGEGCLDVLKTDARRLARGG